MEIQPLTLARRFLMWYMAYPPFNPYATVNFSINFEPAMSYLAELKNHDRPRVTVQHLVSAAIARVYAEYPVANASVFGNQIVRHNHVGAVMPVDLGEEARGEVGAILVEAAESLSLRDLAATTRKRVDKERGSSSPQNGVFKTLVPLVEKLPHGLFSRMLSVVDSAANLPGVGQMLHKLFPLTVIVTNVGSTVGLPDGALSRGGAFTPPNRFFGIGSMLAVFPLQDEVLAEEGRAVVRKVLPLTYVFDHRLFDGVMGGRILSRLVEVLQDPELSFGETGEQVGPWKVGAIPKRKRKKRPKGQIVIDPVPVRTVSERPSK